MFQVGRGPDGGKQETGKQSVHFVVKMGLVGSVCILVQTPISEGLPPK